MGRRGQNARVALECVRTLKVRSVRNDRCGGSKLTITTALIREFPVKILAIALLACSIVSRKAFLMNKEGRRLTEIE